MGVTGSSPVVGSQIPYESRGQAKQNSNLPWNSSGNPAETIAKRRAPRFTAMGLSSYLVTVGTGRYDPAMTRKLAPLLPVLALALVGCSATSAPVAEAPTETPQTQLGKVSTIDEVVDAFTEQGGVCNWKQTDVIVGSVASGNCSTSSVISIYKSVADRDLVVSNVLAMSDFMEEDATLLVGENWIINSAEAEGMVEALGGEYITGAE